MKKSDYPKAESQNVDSDNSIQKERKEAEEAGMTVDMYRKFKKLQAENAVIQARKKEEEEKERQRMSRALKQRKWLSIAFCFSVVLCVILHVLLYSAKKETYINSNLDNSSLPVKVSLSCKLTKYAGLGQDIVIRYYYNGKQIKSGDTIKVGKKFRVQAEIVEVDPSTNDYGDGELSISLPPFDSEKSTYITVNEAGGGGHSGYATWRFTGSAKPNLNYFKVMFS